MSRHQLRPGLLQSGVRSSAAPDTRPLYYVNGSTGNDTTGTGAIGAPWATINKALATVPLTGSRILVAPGTYAENTSALGYLFVTRLYTAKTTVESNGGTVAITDTSGTTYVLRINGSNNIEFKGVTITPTASKSRGIVHIQGTVVHDVDFTGCIIEGDGLSALEFGLGTLTASVSGVRLNSCTVRKASAATNPRAIYALIGAAGYVGLTLNNCTVQGVTVGAAPAVEVTLNNAAGDCDIVLHGGTYTNAVRNIAVYGGDLTIDSGAAISSTSDVAVVYGVDAAGIYTTTGRIANATVTSGSSHALLVGGGSNGVLVDTVTVNGGDHGLVFKECTNCSVINSTLTSGTLSALYFKAAVGCTATFNVIAGAVGNLVQTLYNDVTGNKSQNITLTDNSITATAAANIFSWGNNTQDAGGGVCNRNTYNIHATSGNVGAVRNTGSITTLSALQAAWSGYDVVGNDLASTVVA